MNIPDNITRKDFLIKASLASALTLGVTEWLEAATLSKAPKVKLNNNDIILFQGDSITDSYRKRNMSAPNNREALGTGYAFLAASSLLNKYPEKNLQIYNRGISGDKVFQLAERWEKDCLELKPNVLSILIGVNDYWHKQDGYTGTSITYLEDLKKLLSRTKQSLPEVKLIIAEPFAVKGGISVDDSWYPEFNEFRQASYDIAKEFHAVYIPYQKVFDDAGSIAAGSYWTGDGVHPSMAGAALMAEAWLNAIKG